jgi:cellulose synthase/poly-beta-1,6-N-acetylglucosamine synthase-like glycosyltransferase
MTRFATVLALLSLFGFLWSYAVYPPLVARLARRSGARPAPGAAPLPLRAEVILSAADEENVIAARVANLLAQEAPPGYSISIGCDGCRDRTAERARAAAGQGAVRVFEFGERRGKAAVVNDLVRESRAPLLVFTDANTRFEPGAVRALVDAFEDPAVGAACGRLVFETGASAQATPESEFWDRETRLKEAEGALGVCLGANGAIYAVRRELVTPLPEDTTSMDDFLIPVRVARAGRRVVFAGGAVAREDAARDVAAEVSRRVRIGIGGGQVLRRETWLLNFGAHPALTLAFLSRKAARWLAPLAALAAAGAALFVPPWRVAAAGALGLCILALAAARLASRLTGIAGRLYYFAVLNVALALGVAAGLAGYSRPVWKRTARS